MKDQNNLTISAYEPASWVYPTGVRKRVQQLRNQGLPSIKGWHMITLTIDPKQFGSKTKAYEYCKERLRKFIYRVRVYHGISLNPYFWKLEFQQNGWSHWHIAIDCRGKQLDYDFISRAWPMGMTNCEYCKSDNEYLLKYLVKGQSLPQWVLDYPHKIRFFQSSNLFNQGERLQIIIAQILSSSPLVGQALISYLESELDAEMGCIRLPNGKHIASQVKHKTSRPDLTIRQKIRKWDHSGVIKWDDHGGTRYQLIELDHDFNELYRNRIAQNSPITTEISEIIVDFKTCTITHKYLEKWISQEQKTKLRKTIPQDLQEQEDFSFGDYALPKTLDREKQETAINIGPLSSLFQMVRLRTNTPMTALEMETSKLNL